LGQPRLRPQDARLARDTRRARQPRRSRSPPASRPAGSAGMSAIFDRLPPLTTTGVGSLPFERADEAARHALEAYDLPFCPQLPRLDGDMIAEWLGTDPGRCGWAPD